VEVDRQESGSKQAVGGSWYRHV